MSRDIYGRMILLEKAPDRVKKEVADTVSAVRFGKAGGHCAHFSLTDKMAFVIQPTEDISKRFHVRSCDLVYRIGSILKPYIAFFRKRPVVSAERTVDSNLHLTDETQTRSCVNAT